MKPTIHHVQETVAEFYEVPIAVMTSRRKSQPRHIAMFFARKTTGHSYNVIARWFERRNHTTVISAERKIERLVAGDDAFAADIQALGRNIGSQAQTFHKCETTTIAPNSKLAA